MDRFWKIIERGCLIGGLILAGTTTYYTAAPYYGWNQLSPHDSAPSKVEGAPMIPLAPLLILAAIGIALFIAACVMIFVRLRVFSRRPQYKLTDLTLTENATYRNEVVLISGRKFVGCNFYNVTLLYNGGGTGFDRCKFFGFTIKSDIPDVNGMIVLLHNIGFLKVPVFDQSGIVPPSNPMPEALMPASTTQEKNV
jgi:hypothetical protein